MSVPIDPSAPPQWQSPSGLRLLALLGILVGFALRLYRLGAESLWYDETVSVALAQSSIPALIRHTAGDIHPPGYYLLLHFWQQLTQPTPAFGLEFLYAWPSLVCGLLVVALLSVLGRRFYTPQLGVGALWLAAINPYHIWYSQEVRMYTLGALLGLLCLWALLQWSSTRKRTRRYGWLLVYILASAAGLYTLYYFLFVLVALNGLILLWLCARVSRLLRLFLPWLVAQLMVLLLWAPWIPVFWRQATDPPVPPWRTPWESDAQILSSLAESASALISGQSAPSALAWYWVLALFIILFTVLFHYTNKQASSPTLTDTPLTRNGLLMGYLLIPIGLIYAITQWWTPLYHVRYLFTYAPPLLILLAAAIGAIYQRWRILGGLLAVGLVLVNSWSLYRFWVDPAFLSDDHRGAVTQLAQAWRPGDAILVNAGWVYPALTTYWPTDLVGVDGALPPPIARLQRLIDYRPGGTAALPTPSLVRTGSVGGASTLGWGDPSSDFFAMSPLATNRALLALTQTVDRLWHYRLYDTVSDPDGLIRNWLDDYMTLRAETPLPGRDYLRLQLYQNRQAVAPPGLVERTLPPTILAGDLTLTHIALTAQPIGAGEYLYTNLTWQLPADRTRLPAQLSFSLRLYADDGYLLAQQDETLLPVADWPTSYALTLALPIPVATPPGRYVLRLVAYDAQTGEALVELSGDSTQPMVGLGPLEIAVATRAPVIEATQATFAYVDLVQARVTTPVVSNAQPLGVELIWRPQASAYRDTYVAHLTLVDGTGTVVGQWEDALGGWDYPSGEWPALIPVRDWRFLPIDPATPPGSYTLQLSVVRNSDGQLIKTKPVWWQAELETLVIGTVELQ